MNTLLIIGGGIAAALVVFVGAFRVSLWLTERKSNEDLKRARPDASSIHASDSGVWDGVGHGGGH